MEALTAKDRFWQYFGLENVLKTADSSCTSNHWRTGATTTTSTLIVT